MPATKRRKRKVIKDDARATAKTTKGKLDERQIRILRVLRKTHRNRELTKRELTTAVGIVGKDYSVAWLNSLWDLYHRRYILILEGTSEAGRTIHHHSITSRGKSALEAAERALKNANGR